MKSIIICRYLLLFFNDPIFHSYTKLIICTEIPSLHNCFLKFNSFEFQISCHESKIASRYYCRVLSFGREVAYKDFFLASKFVKDEFFLQRYSQIRVQILKLYLPQLQWKLRYGTNLPFEYFCD